MALVRFFIGDADSAPGWPGYVDLEIDHIAAGYARGADGTCAFCHGDPCAETSPPDSEIVRYFARHRGEGRGLACPCCDGRPT